MARAIQDLRVQAEASQRRAKQELARFSKIEEEIATLPIRELFDGLFGYNELGDVGPPRSQTQLARLVGCSQPTVSRWFRYGTHADGLRMTPKTIEKVVSVMFSSDEDNVAAKRAALRSRLRDFYGYEPARPSPARVRSIPDSARDPYATPEPFMQEDVDTASNWDSLAVIRDWIRRMVGSKWARAAIPMISLIMLVLVWSSLTPQVALSYPAGNGAIVETDSLCQVIVRGRVIGRHLPGTTVRMSVHTNIWYAQLTEERIHSAGEFVIRAYLGGQDAHDLRLEFYEFGIVPHGTVLITGVIRQNACTAAP